MSRAIRVMIADDHAVVRLGLHAILSDEPDIEVVGQAADGIGAVNEARVLRPDVLLMDLRMPGMQGAQAIEELAATAPDVHVLVLTSYADDEHVFPAFRAGAYGYLLKDSGPDELIQAIREVAAGRPALHPVVAARILRSATRAPLAPTSETLTSREKDVLTLVAQGLANKVIAGRLSLSERTVRTYVSMILAKLKLSNRTEATLYALRTGLVRHEEQAQ